MSSDETVQIRTFGRPDTTTPHTTFVQADPSNFRAIVQKLTGAPDLPLTMSPSPRSNPKPPIASPSSTATPPTASSKPGFKLHERRQRKVETIHLGRDNRRQQQQRQYFNQWGFCGRSPGRPSSIMVSPVSPMELFGRRSSSGSPRTPSVLSPKEEEEKAVAEKGFYLHPVSLLGAPRPPELLPLFPLRSPRDQQYDSSTSRSPSSSSSSS